VNKTTELPKGKNYLELIVIAEDQDDDEIEVDLPVLRIFYKQSKSQNK
jgi:hypothetical protein